MTPKQQEAYEEAQRRIAEAKRDPRGFLDLSYFGDLIRLPPEIAELHHLKLLDVSGTRITDISPIADLRGLERLDLRFTTITDLSPIEGMDGLVDLDLDGLPVTRLPSFDKLQALQRLGLEETKVRDLTPIMGHPTLFYLNLRDTPIIDLRPLLSLPALAQPGANGSKGIYGLLIKACQALDHDPTLAALEKEFNSNTIIQPILDHLRTQYPPWPEPLPWEPSTVAQSPPPPPKPKTEPQLQIVNGNLDLASTAPDDADLSDPIKTTLYAQLPDAIAAVARFENRFPEVGGPAKSIAKIVAVAFEEADLLSLHIQTRALQDVRIQDDRKSTIEQMDPDCRAALNRVLDLAPPITLGNPVVDSYEERLRAFASDPNPATVTRGEQLILEALERSHDIATDVVKDLAKTLADKGDDSGTAPARRSVSQWTVLALGTVALGVVAGATGQIGVELVALSKPFLVGLKDAIIAAAEGWGPTFLVWARDMLARLILLIP